MVTLSLSLSQCMDGRGARGLTGVFDGLTLHGFTVAIFNSLEKKNTKQNITRRTEQKHESGGKMQPYGKWSQYRTTAVQSSYCTLSLHNEEPKKSLKQEIVLAPTPGPTQICSFMLHEGRSTNIKWKKESFTWQKSMHSYWCIFNLWESNQLFFLCLWLYYTPLHRIIRHNFSTANIGKEFSSPNKKIA